MEDGATVTGTLAGSGTTLPDARIFTCGGGAVVGAGTFDVPARSGFPHGITATMVTSTARGTGTVVLLEAGSGRVVGKGTFLQAPAGTVACLPPAGALASTTWSGAFAFGATTTL